jgi:hypothetical protein
MAASIVMPALNCVDVLLALASSKCVLSLAFSKQLFHLQESSLIDGASFAIKLPRSGGHQID